MHVVQHFRIRGVARGRRQHRFTRSDNQASNRIGDRHSIFRLHPGPVGRNAQPSQSAGQLVAEVLNIVGLDTVEVSRRGVSITDEVDDAEIAAALLRPALHLLYVGDDIVFDAFGEKAQRRDAGVRQILLERQIQSRRRRRLEVRITRQFAAAAVENSGRGDLLETRARDGRGDGETTDQIGCELVARLCRGEEVRITFVSRNRADMRGGWGRIQNRAAGAG